LKRTPKKISPAARRPVFPINADLIKDLFERISDDAYKNITSVLIGSVQFPAWLQAASGYGYQWWLGTLKVRTRDMAFYGARGRAGQLILVFPDQPIVAVSTGLNDSILTNQPLEMLQRHILPNELPQPPNTQSK
jgi:CubicO group peptidase (beta-lactamase class C family)